MNKFIQRHKLLITVLAVVVLLGSTLGLGAIAASVDASYEVAEGSILNNIPLYTHDGEYVQTYDCGASGQYYESDGTTEFGEEVTDNLAGGEMLVFNNVTSTDSFYAYREDLESFGYLLYNDNDLDGNLYATYVTEETVVTLSYLDNLDQLNILAEPMRALPGLEEENVYQNLKIENKVVLMSCGYVGKENGMCIIYQLCDGSFILYDSGYGYGYHPGGSKGDGYADYWENQAHEIYNTLSKMATESGVNDIVIAAWFFTHPHWDHIGGIIPFANLYAGQVTVEKVIFNWPNHDSMQEMITHVNQKMTHYIELIQDAIEKLGAEEVEAHAGQTFYIRDAVIDVLCTWELQTELSTKYTSVNEGNSISAVCSVKIGGERAIMLGDCGKSSTTTMETLYSGEFLKSDILQIAHHGYNAFTRPLNELVAPDVVLWTNDNLYTSALNNNFDTVPENIYFHDEKITLIDLPYTGEVEYWECEYDMK